MVRDKKLEEELERVGELERGLYAVETEGSETHEKVHLSQEEVIGMTGVNNQFSAVGSTVMKPDYVVSHYTPPGGPDMEKQHKAKVDLQDLYRETEYQEVRKAIIEVGKREDPSCSRYSLSRNLITLTQILAEQNKLGGIENYKEIMGQK